MKITIVIPTYNGRQLLEKYLDSIIAALNYWRHQVNGQGGIIIVDDNSSDETKKWVNEKYPKIKVLVNHKNLRFGESCNRGVKESQGEIVVLLNNDVEPQIDFLLPFLKNFDNPEVFAVGCKEINFENNREIFGGRGEMVFKRGLMIHWRPKDMVSKKTSWVSGGSSAYRKEIWLKLGGFDRLFRPAYEEDRDLSWQALKAGYELVFEPKSIVNHYHKTTNRLEFGEKNIALYSMKNQLLFVWKNISSLKLLAQHFLWLPYHLFITSIRTKGLFFIAFLLALFQLPEAILSRLKASEWWKVKDEEILRLLD